MKYTADFETTTDKNDCRVWAYGLCNIDNFDDFVYGNNIEDFLIFCGKDLKNRNTYKNLKIWFHNAKFDFEFIISYLLNNGYQHITKLPFKDKSFTTLISDKGQFYSMTIYFKYDKQYPNKVEFFDSLKLLPFSVDEVAKGFNLPISKLKINYNSIRKINHKLTTHEIEYVKNDVKIMAMALNQMFKQGLTKMTIASNALSDFKNKIGENNFKYMFPIPTYHDDVKQAYKGGYTIANPIFCNRIIGKGIVLDVNSLYPHVMRNCELPYGEPIFFEGEYKYDKLYPLYIQMIRCCFKLKNNHLPTIQLKNNASFMPTQYLSDSKNDEVTMCLTSIDLKLFFEHYDVWNLEFFSGWKFKSKIGIMQEYIDYWSEQKINAKLNNNKALYTISKLMLNSLYGKFAKNPEVQSKIPYLNDEKIVKYALGEKETVKPIYIPLAEFVTAQARNITIRAAQQNYHRFLYADTDSLHLKGMEIPKNLEISDTKLGAWKIESEFKKAKFIRAKCYLEEKRDYGSNDNFKICPTCAGMPKDCYKYVTFDNFKIGAHYPSKLVMKHVPGGIVLEDVGFTIKNA